MAIPVWTPTRQSPSAVTLSDDRTLVAAAKRDRRNFAPLYQRYVDPVYRYCLRRLGAREAAEDATAQVFVKAMAALPSYQEDGPSFRSWLFAVAHNTLVDAERSRRQETVLAAAFMIVDPAPGPEAMALASEELSEVQMLLATVPPDQRRVLELRLAGLSSLEIASVVGCSVGAVRASQFRAATRLRTYLGSVSKRKGLADV